MGRVWLALAPEGRGLDRRVALKVVRAEHAADPVFQAMLIDEGSIAAAIRHPNVARVREVGEAGGTLFLAMDWIDGAPIHHVVRELSRTGETVPPAIALSIVADVCAGLDAAHGLCNDAGVRLDVVHRDVSPDNVMISANGRAVLIDFGIAKARERLAAATATGLVRGKVPFMSPEQALGTGVDLRSDLWSAGCLLHYLVGGHAPFGGPDDLARLHRITSGSPPDPLPPSTPEVIAAVIDQALSYEPRLRFSSAAEMEQAIRSAQRQPGLFASHDQVAAFLRERVPSLEATRQRLASASRNVRSPARARRLRVAALAVVGVAVISLGGALLTAKKNEAAVTAPPVLADPPPSSGAAAPTNAESQPAAAAPLSTAAAPRVKAPARPHPPHGSAPARPQGSGKGYYGF